MLLANDTLRRVEPGDAALLMASQAWASAYLGRADSATKALNQAAGLASSKQADGDLFGPAEIAGVAGACFEVLARKCHGAKAGIYAERAVEYITAALDSREQFYVRSRALDLLGLANVRLAQSEPAEAVRSAQMALDCTHGLRSTRVRQRFHRFAVRGLERFPRTTEVVEFAEQVRTTVPIAL